MRSKKNTAEVLLCWPLSINGNLTFNLLTSECKGEQGKALPSTGNLIENAHHTKVEPQRDAHLGCKLESICSTPIL